MPYFIGLLIYIAVGVLDFMLFRDRGDRVWDWEGMQRGERDWTGRQRFPSMEENLGPIKRSPVSQTLRPAETDQRFGLATPVEELLDLNSASESELKKLPGVSVAMAKRAIVIQQEGGFSSVTEFIESLGIGAAFHRQIKTRTTVKQIEIKRHTGRILDI